MNIKILMGIPASGKSTYAKELVASDPTYRRINKDDLRTQPYSSQNEKIILTKERAMGLQYLADGYNLIVDDTNLNPIHLEFWRMIAEHGNHKLEVVLFDVPVEECIERDKNRVAKVGEEAIRSLYKQYKLIAPSFKPRIYSDQNNQLPHCIVFDMDGTLALSNGRGPYDEAKVLSDLVNEPVANILREAYTVGKKIIILTGRTSNALEDTKQWMRNHAIPFDLIYSRNAGDMRKDAIVKKELFDRYIKDRFYVEAWYDDRNQVVDMVRKELNLLCLQVYYGNF